MHLHLHSFVMFLCIPLFISYSQEVGTNQIKRYLSGFSCLTPWEINFTDLQFDFSNEDEWKIVSVNDYTKQQTASANCTYSMPDMSRFKFLYVYSESNNMIIFKEACSIYPYALQNERLCINSGCAPRSASFINYPAWQITYITPTLMELSDIQGRGTIRFTNNNPIKEPDLDIDSLRAQYSTNRDSIFATFQIVNWGSIGTNFDIMYSFNNIEKFYDDNFLQGEHLIEYTIKEIITDTVMNFRISVDYNNEISEFNESNNVSAAKWITDDYVTISKYSNFSKKPDYITHNQPPTLTINIKGQKVITNKLTSGNLLINKTINNVSKKIVIR